MNTDEKIKHFMDLSIQSATQQVNDSFTKYKIGLDNLLEKHKADSISSSEEMLQQKKDAIEQNIRKEYANHESEIKRQIVTSQNEKRQLLFDEVNTLLDNYRKTPEYKALLSKKISNAITFAGNDKIDIYLDPEDSPLKDSLEKDLNIPLNIYNSSFKGGIKAVIPEKNILIDESFQAKLIDLSKNYRMKY